MKLKWRNAWQDEEAKVQGTLTDLGPVAAVTLRAELGEINRFAHSDQVISYAGMEPGVRERSKWKLNGV